LYEFEPLAARRVLVVADRGKDRERAQQWTGDLEEALPVALVAAAVDEIAGEDGEVGLLVGERVVERGVDVVTGAHVAVDGEAQRNSARRVDGGLRSSQEGVTAARPCQRITEREHVFGAHGVAPHNQREQRGESQQPGMSPYITMAAPHGNDVHRRAPYYAGPYR